MSMLLVLATFQLPATIVTVSTSLNGLMCLIMPITSTLLTRYTGLGYYCVPTGLHIVVWSLLMSSFAIQIW